MVHPARLLSPGPAQQEQGLLDVASRFGQPHPGDQRPRLDHRVLLGHEQRRLRFLETAQPGQSEAQAQMDRRRVDVRSG